MTGDRERAGSLSAAALLHLLADPPDEDADARHLLLLDLAHRALDRPGRSTWLERGERRESYTVEDEVRRVRASLDRLEPLERAALVLNRYASLPEELLGRALAGSSRAELGEALAGAAGRVASAAARDADAPVADLLNRLLIDAPADDLWDEIEKDLRSAWAARRNRQRLLTGAAATIVLLLFGGSLVWLADLRIGWEGDADAHSAGAAATPTTTARPRSTEGRAAFAAAATPEVEPIESVGVADLHFFRMIEQAGEGRSTLMTYDPDTNTTAPLLGAGGQPLVSPDGRWIIATRALREDTGMSLLAGAPVAGDGVAWEVRLATPRALAVGDDSVYALNLIDPETYQIQAIDLVSGRVTLSWPLGERAVTPGSVRAVRLAISPDGTRLSVLAARFDQNRGVHARSLTLFNLADGSALDSFTLIAAPGEERGASAFSVAGARPVPGEHVLYSVIPDDDDRRARVQFLDLDRGTLASVGLPLLYSSSVEGQQRGENEIHLIPSNTGRMLYVIQSRQRRVAVVDMRARSLIGVFPLDAGPYDQMDLESALNRVTYVEAVLSPDGERLYMANNREKNQSINGYPSQSPVWVFDTSTWQAVDRWAVGGLPRTMTMSGDGSRVLIHSARSDGGVHLTIFDAATGETLNVRRDVPGPEWADIQRIASLSGLYHAQYGVRPSVGDLVPRDNSIVAVLPGIVVEAENAVAGAEILVTARVVHPLTGETAVGDSDLRFDPEAMLAIELSHGAQQVILVPASVEPGVYQGRTRLEVAGSWSARVTLINRDGTIWTVASPAPVEVVDGLVASDGGAYRFLVDPANPVNRRTITLRVWLVGAQSGDRLQQDIQFLDSIVGAPTLLLDHPGGEHHEVLLEPLDHASYLGWVRLAEHGQWTARVVLELASGERYTVNAGIVEIKDLTEPYRRAMPAPGGDGTATSRSARMGIPASK